MVPPTVDLVQLAPLGCGMQTGAGSVLNVAKPSPSQPIVIAGLGGVGHAALFAALSLSLETIIVVDVNEKRLEQVDTAALDVMMFLTLCSGQSVRCHPCFESDQGRCPR